MTTAPTATLAGHPVGRIGFGAMQLGDGPGWASERARSVALLRRAVELGVRHLDTAPFYGAGLVDELIREALAPYPDDLVLVSKVGARTGPDGGLRPAQRPAQLRAAIEAELDSLGVGRLAVVNLRRLDRRPGLLATGEDVVDLDDQLAELVALRDEGKIGAIGLSSVTTTQLRQALPVGIACVQNAYNLLHRDDEALLAECRAHDVRWVPYFPLGSAFPAMPSVAADPTVRAVAARLGVSPHQVGLAWLLDHDPNTLLIPGTSDPLHLDANCAAADVALDEDARPALDALAPVS